MTSSGSAFPARRLLLPLLFLIAALFPAAAGAAAAGTKSVSYRGYTLTVPRSWPVFHISAGSTTCVRFNRHAVYLGAPGGDQRCPTDMAGRTGAILVQPLASSSAGTAMLSGAVARIADKQHAVKIIATWQSGRGGAVRTALRLRSLSATARASVVRPKAASVASEIVRGNRAEPRKKATAAAVSTPGEVYNGQGLDACNTPSSSVMSAWTGSSYDAIGVYIGGQNMACSQPNLTSSWVTAESDAGWHMIPIYVGLQAPTNGCGCQSIAASSAASEGASAATAAVAEMQALGMGSGNPIYYDMENYTTTTANTTAVLTFLQAWTETLHTDGYLSGVYSSDSSGITNLASAYGTGYVEPDDLWFANWNDAEDVNDSYATTTEWPDGQRMHQYSGATNVTEGGQTLNIDNDYLYAQTAAAGSGATSATAGSLPAATTVPTISGAAVAGQTLTEQHGSWSGTPTSYSYQWQLCNSAGGACASIKGATKQTLVVTAADVGHELRVVETAKNAAGSGAGESSAATATVTGVGYWLYSAFGNVYNSADEPFYGSPQASHVKVSNVIGLARTSDGAGYWLATATGRVYAYGDAVAHSGTAAKGRVVAIVADPAAGGGYWLLNSTGSVYNHGTTFYGSPLHSGHRLTNVVDMAATADGRGYWVVTAAGRVYAYGDARLHRGPAVHQTIVGIAANHGGKGYWLYTASGAVYNYGSSFYGSPPSRHVKVSGVIGLAPTTTGKGYWLITSAGKVYSYGNAAQAADPRVSHPLVGAASGS